MFADPVGSHGLAESRDIDDTRELLAECGRSPEWVTPGWVTPG